MGTFFFRGMLDLQTNFTKQLLQHDVAQHDWKVDKFSFKKPNHIVPHHVVKDFFVKLVCKPIICFFVSFIGCGMEHSECNFLPNYI
jgi:hypothetical protein